MTNERVKEILGKQLELLAEKSTEDVIQNVGHLAEYSYAMLKIAEFIKED